MAQQANNQQPRKPGNGGKRRGSTVLYIIYGVIMIALSYSFFGSDGSASKRQITWERLEPILEKHDYKSITVVNQEVAEIRIKPEAVKNDTVTYVDLITRTLTGGTGHNGY